MAYTSERSPLLTSLSTSSTRQSQGIEPNVEVGINEMAPSGGAKIVWSIFRDSIPVIMSYILQNSVQTVSVIITGRLGPHELSVAAFSLMLAFVTGWCIALGGTTALDTLGSQAFTGSSRRTDLSVHFQRCVVLLWILLVPVCVLWAYVEPVLLSLGQPPDLSRDVQAFLRILILGAPGYIGFESLKKYLQCQGIMRLSTIVLVVIFPVNIGLNVALMHYTRLGLWGSPAALSITYWLAFTILGILTYLSPTHHAHGTWGGIQFSRVFHVKNCITFLKLALPGILMVGTEWAAFEIVALCAGRLGALPLAAQSVIMTFDQILNTLPFGIGVAASNRVGNLIGARSAVGAKHAAHASALLSVVVGAIVMTALIVFKDVCGYVMSDDDSVVRLVSKVMPLVASFQISDGLAGSCGGALRGQGRQHLGAIFNFVAYYIIALPMGITLAFHQNTQLGLQGLWIGQVVGLTVVGISEYLVIWIGTDWDIEVEKGVKRNQEEVGPA